MPSSIDKFNYEVVTNYVVSENIYVPLATYEAYDPRMMQR